MLQVSELSDVAFRWNDLCQFAVHRTEPLEAPARRAWPGLSRAGTSMTAVESLAAEHQAILESVTWLERVAARLAAGAAVDGAILVDLVELCDLCVHRSHIIKEEQGLFPLLETHGLGPDITVVSALLAQHQTGSAFLREMRNACNRLASGDHHARHDFLVWARDYVGLVREHIRIEDQYFYSLAAETLQPADDTMLKARFERIERVSQGSGEMDRCRSLRERMRATVAAW